MISRTGRFGLVSNRTSRLVRMPTSRPLSSSTTGMPEIPCSSLRRSASLTGRSGAMVSGLTTMPASNFLTRRTSCAWASGVIFLWMMPRPPACAMAMASRLSVTVSMAAEISGMPRRISLVTLVSTAVSVGSTVEAAGISVTSSKVSASRTLHRDPCRVGAHYTQIALAAKRPAAGGRCGGCGHSEGWEARDEAFVRDQDGPVERGRFGGAEEEHRVDDVVPARKMPGRSG